jgi:hypothetical protein
VIVINVRTRGIVAARRDLTYYYHPRYYGRQQPLKWLDEKGRIAGVINLFDLLVLLAVGLLTWYYWFQVPPLTPPSAPEIALPASKSKIKTKARHKRVPAVLEDVQFVFRDMSPTLARGVRVGDKDITHPKTAAEVVEVLSTEPEVDVIDLGSRKALAFHPGDKRLVRVQMRIQGQRDRNTFYYKNQPLKSGSFYTFITPRYTLIGEALRNDEPTRAPSLSPKRWLRIWAEVKNIDKYMLEMIKAGDKALRPTKITTRTHQLELKEILRNHPRNGVRQSQRGLTSDMWDVELMLECLCARGELGYHYGNIAIRAGLPMKFQTRLYSFELVIQKLEVLPVDYKPQSVDRGSKQND